MKILPAVGAVLLMAGSIFALRIVLHSYTDHEYLDVFHLIVGLVAAALSVALLLRSRRPQS